MLLKTVQGWINNGEAPVMLVLTDDEKRALLNMPPGHNMIVFYPDSKNYADELIRTWMVEGIVHEDKKV